MSIFRIEKDKSYTVMSNYHLRDRNLSYKAKGMLSFMLSLPDDWDYSLKGLVSISKENIKAIRAILSELENYGYFEKVLVRGYRGHFKYEYIIREIPKTLEKQQNPPYSQKGYAVEGDALEGDTLEEHQINTNNKDKIDNIDKTSETIPNSEEIFKEREHHKLTNELIKTKYIRKDDVEADCFDEIFKNYLSSGATYTELMGAIHYIAPRVVKRKFNDSRGRPIENKIMYFKNSFEENIERFQHIPDEIYPEFDELER